jgi:3-hydroxybutyryl-CoA dehydrogenase
MTDIRRIGVCGGGLMGAGIAQACAQAGYATVVREVSDVACAHARASIERSLAIGVEKGKVTEEQRTATLERLRMTTDTSALRDADIIIEAIIEDIAAKYALFAELDTLCPEHTCFASNTSSLSITELAAGTHRADRVVGLHFFNPVPLMKLVEVIRGVRTSEDTVSRATAFVASLGKTSVQAPDSSGFIVNRLLVPYMLDAVRAVEHRVASIIDIDTGMMLGAGHPMGPLTLLDFVGLDTAYRIAEIMFTEYREPRYAPPPLLKRMVNAGMFGRKSGLGFYDYAQTPPVPHDLGI